MTQIDEARFGTVEEVDGGRRMRVVDPPAVLEYTWGTDVLRFELEDDGDGCVLTLLDTVAERGTEARTAAGWHVCLDALGAALAGAAPHGPGWADVHVRYVVRLGPEASTIGPPAGLHLT